MVYDLSLLNDLRRRQRALAQRVDGADDSSTIEEMRTRIGLLEVLGNPLASLLAADFDSTADQVITGLPGGSWVVRRIVVSGASVSLTTAAGGIYTAASKGGVAVVGAAQTYTALVNGNKFLDLTLSATAMTDILSTGTLYFSLTTPQGAAATANIHVFGDPLP